MADSFAQDELRAFVDLKLKDPKFLQALYRELKPNYTNDQLQKLDQDELYKIIIKKGLLETLIKQGEDPFANTKTSAFGDDFAPNENIPLDDINLKVTIAELKGLTEYLDKADPRKKLTVSISFLRNRRKTKPVQSSLNPIIDQTFMLSFGSLFEANQTTFDYLLKLRSLCSIAVIEEDTQSGSRRLLSEKQIEWRFVLVHKSLTLNLELASVVPPRGPLGIMKIHMQIVAKGGQNVSLNEATLDAQLDAEAKAKALAVKQFYSSYGITYILGYQFYEFSQNWYNEYRSLKPEFAKRAVKIYAEHNTGAAYEASPMKPVYCYLSQLSLRGIDSPEHAARFVSLIPFIRPSGEQSPLTTWRYPHSFLAEGRGEVQDHALLLCSLLLGFGLDAYVCIGSCTDGAHAWVLTRHIETVGQISCRMEKSRRHYFATGKV